MNTTITIGDALLLLIGICAVILLVYVIRVVRNCIPAVKSLTKILDDTQKVTGVVSEATTGMEEVVSTLSESTTDMADFIKNNQSTVKAVVSLVNAVVSIRKLLS
ncbi:MAG: hypothetical protein IKV96_04855 [Firmicutes bacterium]|nr:hypothetical protein [Bacillota bacterium]